MLGRNRQSITQVAAMHQDNLRKRLQRRIEVARSQGNEHLLRQLEAELKYLN
jgi:hypothetical protein